MYYLLLYDVVDDFVNRRAPYRQEHLKLITEAHERGELLMAGAFAEPADGGVLLFRVDDPEVIKQFVQDDPYVTNELVTR